uniref:AB hydrolase-1 domain-containing protein n=1 Tax=Eutreptiella gymnastica TaxID=73025 RepID=A0A7S4G0G9_9EUGL
MATAVQGEFGSHGVILTHPHPKLGGDQHNNVVQFLQRTLASSGFTTLRFDFRGVNESKGSSTWMGRDERNDVLAAIDYLTSLGSIHKLWLVGYSFGSAVCAHPASIHTKVAGYAAVSYPAGRLASVLLGCHWSEGVARIASKPKFFVIGDSDQFAGAEQLDHDVQGLEGPSECVVVPGANHFWFGSEAEMAQSVLQWLTRQIRGSAKQ